MVRIQERVRKMDYLDESRRILREARDLIRDPQSWTQGEYARDGQGRPVLPTANSACRFCAVGAINAASGSNNDAGRNAINAFEQYADYWAEEDEDMYEDCEYDGSSDPTIDRPMYFYSQIEAWNDDPGMTHDHVMHGFQVVLDHLDRVAKL